MVKSCIPLSMTSAIISCFYWLNIFIHAKYDAYDIKTSLNTIVEDIKECAF